MQNIQNSPNLHALVFGPRLGHPGSVALPNLQQPFSKATSNGCSSPGFWNPFNQRPRGTYACKQTQMKSF